MIVVTKSARHRIFRPIGIGMISMVIVIAIVMTVRRAAFEFGAWEKGWSFRSGTAQSPVHRASEEASPSSAAGIAIQAPGGSGSFALFQQTLASVQAQLAKVSSPTTLGKNSTLTITDSGILKPTDHNQTQGGIGTDVSRIGKIWGTFMDLNDNVAVNGKLDLSGKLTANGGVQIGDSGADELQINSSLISSVVPKTTNSIDLGSTTYRFRTGYFTTSLVIGSGTTTITGTDVTTTNLTVTNLTVASLNSTSAADVDIRASGDNDITVRAGDGASDSTADGNDLFVSAEDSGLLRFGDFSLTVSEDATYPLTLRSSSGGIQLSTGSTDNGNLTLYSAGTLTLDSSTNNTTILLQAGTGGINLSAGTARLTGNLIVTGTTALNGITYTWPGADGSSGQALTTNASGVLSWSAVSSSFTDSGTYIYPTNSARKFIYGYEGQLTGSGYFNTIGNDAIILRAGQGALDTSTSGATSTTADIQLAAADALLATAGTLNLLASNDSTYPLILRSSQGGIQLSTQSTDNGNLTLYSAGTLTLDTSRNNTNIVLSPGSGAVSLTSTATTSDVLTLSASSLTSGSGLVLTGPSGATAGVTDALLKITGDAGATGTTNGLVSSTATIDDATSGSAVNLYLSTTNSPSAYNAAYGIYSTLTDATALDNSTLYGEYQKVTLTNNAYKEATGVYVELSSASTTGDLLTGGYFDTRSTGAISTGSKSMTSIFGSVSNNGPDTGGTSTVYGGYFSATSNTGGTSTAYGAYATASVADTLYALYASLPIGVGAGSTGYAIYADAGTGAGTEYAAVLLNGNVGIGTAAPAGMLDVKGTASGVLLRAGASSLQLSSSATSTTADIELAAADQMDLFAGRFSLTTSSGTAGDVKIDSAGTLTLSTSRNNTNINILTGSGKIGVNMTAAPSYTLDVSGTGRFSCANDFANVSHSTFCSDVAETYETNDPTLEPGDVLVIDTSSDTKVARSQEEYDPKTVGVYSTSPGLLVGGETILGGTSTTSTTGTTSNTNDGKKVPVALVGRVPVKIAGSSQPIAVGDFLTASGEPGKAMKATRAGYTIGKALESWQPRATSHEPRATIEVFVNLGYFMGTMTADGFIDTSSVATASPSAATDQISDSALSTSQSESNFESLQTRIAQLEELVYTMTGSSDKLQGTSDKLPEASGSASPFASQDVSNDVKLSGDLTVLGSTNLADTTIGGKLIVGVIAVDDIGGSIDALGTALKIQPSGLADVEFMGGKIIVTKAGDLEIKTGMIAGNSSFRDAVVMPASPAGQGSLRIDTSWKTAPMTVTVTPTWNTTVWVEDLSSSGFTIHVGASPSAPAKLFWLAIW